MLNSVTRPQKNVLFVCTANQQRSPTAEEIYRNDRRFAVRSAGTHMLANRQVTNELVRWADLIVVMEEHHARAIRDRFPDAIGDARLIVLGIPDIYQYMDRALQREIRDRFEQQL